MKQAYCLPFKAWTRDLMTNLLAAYPMLILTVDINVQVHLSSHKCYFTRQVPDFVRNGMVRSHVRNTPASTGVIACYQVLR